jgi:lipocalin-like protein
VSVRRTTALLAVLLLAGAQTSRSHQLAGPRSESLAGLLVGHWSLVSFAVVSGDVTEYPFGPEAVGEIRYDPAGHMAVQIMKTGREPFAVSDHAGGTPTEVSAAFGGYVAYYGRYSVDEGAGVVIHHVSASMFPNWTGSEQRRQVVIDGDRLTLSTPPTLFQGRQRVQRFTWKRLE